jgi:hypothetical protein
MVGKMVLAATLALVVGATAFAADESGSVDVVVKGVMQEDKGGMFIVADGVYYDLVFSDENSSDMKKFHSSLEGDMVKVTGQLVVETGKEGKMRLVVLANDMSRLRGVRAKEVKYEARVVQERPVYVERPGIRVPFVRINW